VQTIEEMQSCLLAAYPNDSVVGEAVAFAKNAHAGQRRKNGEPYITHPLYVACYLMRLRMDAETIAAALLHDVLEDCEVTKPTLTKVFGVKIALLVDSLTKLKLINMASREERNAEALRKMLLAMAQDVRVVIIKLADRLHNIETLGHQPPEAQKRIARETLDIYAPLAHRLGMYQLCIRLEDISFSYLEPEIHAQISQALESTLREREAWMGAVSEELTMLVQTLDVDPFEIESRTKHIYSIYQKMKQQNRTFDQVYDVFAFRVIVPELKDCYTVLGVVHNFYKPVPGRFKDYISVKKANNYQSLHTTVVGRAGIPFEVQIRTVVMHHQAEYGIAAHWLYKEGKSSEDALQTTLTWFRQFMESQSDLEDAQDFLDTLKTNLFSDEVFVFTPKGDVVTLPAGATAVDFAYSIHSAIGNRCMGAKANGRIISIEQPLRTGEIIEIITGPANRGPSRDWMSFVRTSEAKSKIRAWFKLVEKDENIQRGRELLELAARRLGHTLPELQQDGYVRPLLKRYNMKSLEDLHATVGCGGLTTQQVLMRLVEAYKKDHKIEIEPQVRPVRPRPPATHGVDVHGEGNMLVRFANCCNPVPGDDIIGYITRGRGVSVHRRDCPNYSQGLFETERLVDVSWQEDTNAMFKVELQLSAANRSRLISDITIALTDMSITLQSMSANLITSMNMVSIHLFCDVTNTSELNQLVHRLRRIEGIRDVQRAGQVSMPRGATSKTGAQNQKTPAQGTQKQKRPE